MILNAVVAKEKAVMEKLCREDEETIREFLVESYENLSRLDHDLVELEKHPQDAALLGSIFRTFHTIKGACGFLGFSVLETITHHAENLLSQLRDGKRRLDFELVSLILDTVDATRTVLASIEANGAEGQMRFEDLTEQLRGAAQSENTARVEISATYPVGPDDPPRPIAEPGVLKETSSAQRQVLPDIREAIRETRRERRKPPRGEDEEFIRSSAADANIRVGVPLLDRLMDLVGELLLIRNQIRQLSAEYPDGSLNATSRRLNLLTSDLQECVMKTRMQPIGVVWNNLPRVVRDMAVFLDKQIEVRMDGAEIELDRTIIEAIRDPLIHLVRNSCDHGIELPEVRAAAGKPQQGIMTLRAYHEDGHVNIEVADDGAGIDVDRVRQKAIDNHLMSAAKAGNLSDGEALNLVFLPGFSLKQEVTNLSGRGVGMDVVKSHIEKIGGVANVFSRPGEGTTVKIRIPLTLALTPGLGSPAAESHSPSHS